MVFIVYGCRVAAELFDGSFFLRCKCLNSLSQPCLISNICHLHLIACDLIDICKTYSAFCGAYLFCACSFPKLIKCYMIGHDDTCFCVNSKYFRVDLCTCITKYANLFCQYFWIYNCTWTYEYPCACQKTRWYKMKLVGHTVNDHSMSCIISTLEPYHHISLIHISEPT